MPDCPNCHVELGFGFEGGICPKCKTIYTPYQVSKMPGYDHEFVLHAAAIFVALHEQGALKKGINKVETYEDGIIITHHELPD